MKTLLVGINAKYIHSNLAIRYLQKYVEEHGYFIDLEEFTINQDLDYILWEIYKIKPKVLGFSAYLWNIDYILKIAKTFKKISKETFILVGGPEVSYDAYELLCKENSIDAVIYGEGEETFYELIESLNNNKTFETINGLVYRKGSSIIKNEPRSPISMEALPFVYHNKLDQLKNRIIYYETIRGCPFNCQYCISSIEKGVRFKEIGRVKDELQYFLDNKVKQVKFVDRTFNCNKEHAMNIWKYLHTNDNGVSNFHFEISADLLDDEMISFLNLVRPNLFQFEIGIQSTHTDTIVAIKRKTNFELIVEHVKKLEAGNNINLHLDLIAGLPFEGYNTFKLSFNDVYKLKPDQLQLGFLKVLKGSGMHINQEKYGIKYRDEAPYEVLCTNDMSFEELGKLKMIEDIVERYYNSSQFYFTILYIQRFFESPFDFYECFSEFWEVNGYFKLNHSRIQIATILKDFSYQIKGINKEFLLEIIKFDFCLFEKVKKFPDWLENSDKYKKEVIGFYQDEANIMNYLPQLRKYNSKQISRMAHMEVFDYDMTKYMSSSGEIIDKKTTAILFNYYDKDGLRHNSRVFKINLK